MPATRRPYAAGHFQLEIDGHRTTAYLKSVDTGRATANTIKEGIGAENKRIKHISTIDIEPVTVEFGISGATEILKWIQASVDKKWSRRNGQITHADFDMRSTYEYEFRNALITEVGFPTLDGSAREAAYMTLKFQPEMIETRKASGQVLSPVIGSKQKSWMASSFRLRIDGIDELQYCNKIDAFAITQTITKVKTGFDRFAEIEPNRIDFPDISGTIALEYADKLLQWHHTYVMKGQADPKAQKTGAIEFLDPTKTKVIFAVNLFEVGITNVQVVKATANQEQIKRVKFDLYVGSMKLDGPGLGLE